MNRLLGRNTAPAQFRLPQAIAFRVEANHGPSVVILRLVLGLGRLVLGLG